MKKVLFFIAALVASATMFAQQKGEMCVGGNIGLNAGGQTLAVKAERISVSSSAASPFSFNISPEFGYFVTDKFKIGASLGYGVSTYEGATHHQIMIGPELNYYKKLADKFYYTPGIGLYFGFYIEPLEDEMMKVTLMTPSLMFNIALNLLSCEFRPANHWAIAVNASAFAFTLRYRTESQLQDEKVAYSLYDYKFNLAMNVGVGVRYYF